MGKQSRIVKFLLVVFIICLVVGILLYKYLSRDVYILDIPNSYNLDSIAVESDKGINTTSDEAEMDDILKGLDDLNLKTQIESIQDFPVNVSSLISIKFYYREDSALSLYVYEKNNRYYLEEPYNGIYKLDENTYNYIINLVYN